MTEGVIDQTTTGTETAGAVVDQAQPEAAVSISDHAARYSEKGRTAEAAKAETPGDDLKPIRPVDQQKRDQGKFAQGHQRIKPSAAVERINTLTSRAKTAEERAADLEQRHAATEARLATAESELAQLRRQGGTPQQIAKAEQKVERAEAAAERVAAPADDPEPQEADPKYAGDYGQYLKDHARWSARDEWRQIDARNRQAATQRQQQHAAGQALKSFGARMDAAKGKYADFHQVALAQPAPWEEGSPIDAFIMEHETGPDVLYYLQSPSQAQQVDELLRLKPLDQLMRLAAIAQRFSSSPSAAAGTTGAAAGRQVIVQPPKPPTPVRTEAQRASGTPPPTDGSLSIAEHGRSFGPKRR